MANSGTDDVIVLVPDGFELEADGRMVELPLLHDEGVDLLWANRIEAAKALAGDLLIVAEQAEAGPVQS
jgi:hypothetical protein